MNSQHKYTLIFVCTVLASCIFANYPVKVIYETDMGNDIDDVLALDMLYKYQDLGLAEIQLISINKANPYSVPFLDIMNTFYGYPNIPLAMVKDSPVGEGNGKSYVQTVSEYWKDSVGFQQVLKTTDSISSSIAKYRQILSLAQDSSVVIISVGFLTNLHQLLLSLPDEYSNLCGKELLRKKVKLLSVMGGDFRQEQKKGEFNIRYDIASAQSVFQDWPTEILVSTWEVGGSIIFPGSIVLSEINYKKPHPMIIAYEDYLPTPYDRETWDLTSVLVAVEPKDLYFNLSPYGEIEVDEKGFTSFRLSPEGKCRYLIVDDKKKIKVINHFVELITQQPKIYNY